MITNIKSFGKTAKDKGVEVNATINHIDVRTTATSDETDTTYLVYVDYTYNGKKYTNIRYPSHTTGMKEGDTIKGKINPKKPTEFYSSTQNMIMGVVLIIMSIFMLFMFLVPMKRFNSRWNTSDY